MKSKQHQSLPVLATLLIILLVAVLLRLHQLNTLPPGLFMDEAINGLDAQNVWRNGRFSLFFPANNGREPLYIYLQAMMMALVGEHAFTIRLVSAYIGILTVPLVYVLGKALFHRQTSNARFIGLTASAALAISFPHISLSRIGFRAILLPFMVTLTILWLWWGWERKQMRWFIMAGLALGLSQYTYIAARALPLVLVIFPGIVLLLHDKRKRSGILKPIVKGTAYAGLCALLVFLPLGIYFLTSSTDASTRTEDVSLLAEATAKNEAFITALAANTISVAHMFFDRGDFILRHNLPYRAILDWLNVVGFVTGLIVLLRHWRQPQTWLLIIWTAVMLLPTILSTPAPHTLRASGALGAIVIIVAVGLVWCWQKSIDWLNHTLNWQRPFLIWLLLPLLVLAISGTISAKDYFINWKHEDELYDEFESVELAAARTAIQALKDGDVYLIPDIPAQRSPILQLFIPPSKVRPLPAECPAYQPEASTPVTYLIRTQRDETTLPQLQAILPHGVVAPAVTHPVSGEVFFTTYTIYPDEDEPPTSTAVAAQFGDAIQLTQAEIQKGNDALHIKAIWKAVQPPMIDYTLFIHLYPQGKENQAPVAQFDLHPCYPTWRWQTGEALQETYALSIPSDLPPGDYTLGLGWYTWPSFERLPLTASVHPLPDERHQLGQITIED